MDFFSFSFFFWFIHDWRSKVKKKPPRHRFSFERNDRRAKKKKTNPPVLWKRRKTSKKKKKKNLKKKEEKTGTSPFSAFSLDAAPWNFFFFYWFTLIFFSFLRANQRLECHFVSEWKKKKWRNRRKTKEKRPSQVAPTPRKGRDPNEISIFFLDSTTIEKKEKEH